MVTAKDELHEIVEHLSDNGAEEALSYLRLLAVGEQMSEEGTKVSVERPAGPIRLSGREFRTRPRRSLHELAVEQGVKPIASLESLRADFWPEDESIDDFLAAVREWRRNG